MRMKLLEDQVVDRVILHPDGGEEQTLRDVATALEEAIQLTRAGVSCTVRIIFDDGDSAVFRHQVTYRGVETTWALVGENW